MSLKLDDEERSRLATLAAARKRSSHYLMREAVREYLTREEARKSFRDEADKALRDYEANGLHATQAEIDAWVELPRQAPAQARAQMAQVVYSPNAISNLARLHRFLDRKNPEAATRAIRTIRDRLAMLSRFPRLGPVDPERPDIRELFVRFGAAGYVARYGIVEETVVSPGRAPHARGRLPGPAARRAYAATASPVVSSTPVLRLMTCTAAPDAPLPRLSSEATARICCSASLP